MSETGEVSVNADKAKPNVEVKIGNRTYKIKYTLWTFCKLEEITGKNPIAGDSWSNVHPSDLLALLWAGIQHEENPPTMQELGQQIEMSDIAALFASVQKAMGQSSPAEDEQKKSLPE